MPAQRKPEDIVPTLLDHLKKARDALRPNNKNNKEIVSRFEEIETKLDKMKHLFPRIKDWEGQLINQFRSLEQEIDDDNFFNGLEHDNANEILDGLKRIEARVASVQLLSAEQKFLTQESQQTDRTSSMPSSGKDQTQFEQWWRLHVEKNIYASKAMSDFRKSFDCLESNQLKICSLSLSIFPENSIIKKRPLIYWWIGERMVTKTSERTAEEVGEDVFRQFINDSFIIPKSENPSPCINSFIVHPWIRRMLILVAKELNFFDSWTLKNGHRRAFLFADSSDSYNEMPEHTLTVFNVDYKYLGFKRDWLSKLNGVEVLQLGRWQNSVKHHIEVENEDLTINSKKKHKVKYEVSLNGLESQTSLRYLSLRGVSRVTNLPRSVLNLTSLEILDLRACHSLEKLPSDISALRNLTHLDVSECYLLESMPTGIEKLSALQVLKGFVIGRVGRNQSKLSYLSRLKSLRKLSIRIGNEALGEAELSSLKELQALQILVISFGVVSRPSSTEAAMSIFSVPPNLKKIDLRCSPFKRLPDCLRPKALTHLEKLYIRGGELSSLEPLDEQWKIKILLLKYLKKLKVDEPQLRAMFPEAVYLMEENADEKAIVANT